MQITFFSHDINTKSISTITRLISILRMRRELTCYSSVSEGAMLTRGVHDNNRIASACNISQKISITLQIIQILMQDLFLSLCFR